MQVEPVRREKIMSSRGKKKKIWKAIKEAQYQNLRNGYDNIISNLEQMMRDYNYLGEEGFLKKYGAKIRRKKA